MQKRNIIVIGASAGGFEAFKQLIAQLPADLEAAIFIVWHMAPSVRGVLPQVLGGITSIPTVQATDGERVQTNRIYVAPPDHHMLLEDDQVRITHGPKENRFRPAIDPLFRSAAYTYGNRVIGIILSGALDDGTAGLWTIKSRGGLALVQDPHEALVAAMPENAIREVAVDYIVTLDQMAPLLVRLTGEDVAEQETVAMNEDQPLKTEIDIASEAQGTSIIPYGQLTPYTCPECHGVLMKLTQGTLTRFRCHTGHAYSIDTLLAAVSEHIEDALYSAIRGMDESMLLLNHMGDHYAEVNRPRQAALFFQKAQDVQARLDIVRQAVLANELLSNDTVIQATTEESVDNP